MPLRRSLTSLGSAVLVLCSFAFAQSPGSQDWPSYGGDAGGQRYSGASQINRDNVQRLKPVWEYHTGALASRRTGYKSASFEATPILFHDTLYFATPFDEIFALDASTGEKRWSYDPQLLPTGEGNLTTSRGVAIWHGPEGIPRACRDRIIASTLDARLIEVDALNGKPCADFGIGGQVNVKPGYPFVTITSPPTIAGNVIVVGSSIADNFAVEMPLGKVQAYDAISGRALWSWDPIPWAEKQKIRTGAANAWSIISADPALGLVYIPTGSASPDYFGGLRPGADADADSVVAIAAATGRKAWSFQLVHHDLWDYDTAAQPLLFTFRDTVPAIAVTNKTGMVYVLNRKTGVPLYPVEERPVPASDVIGEQTSPTQPFSDLPPLGPLTLPDACRQLFPNLRYEGIFTPPSLRGTLESPGKIGGVNWGSAAFDPETGIYYAANNHSPFNVRLIKRSAITTWTDDHIPMLPFSSLPLLVIGGGMLGIGYFGRRFRRASLLLWIAGGAMVCIALEQSARRGMMATLYTRVISFSLGGTLSRYAIFDVDDSPMLQTPYSLYLSPLNLQRCKALSPSAITALNLQTGKRVWEHPLSTPELGGPIVTRGGLVFAAGTREPYLRAFDKLTGQELWSGRLPVSAQATPMTYMSHGRQFVVIAAGGHGLFATTRGDSLVAFALPSTPSH